MDSIASSPPPAELAPPPTAPVDASVPDALRQGSDNVFGSPTPEVVEAEPKINEERAEKLGGPEVHATVKVDMLEIEQDSLLTPETLRTPEGLTVEIKDRAEAQAVADQLNDLRTFLSGDIDRATLGSVEPVEAAIMQLSDLAALHLGDIEFGLAQGFYERLGMSPDEMQRTLAELRSVALQRTSDTLSQATRATDTFRHRIQNQAFGRIITSGAIQPKTRQLAQGHNFVSTGGTVGAREQTADEFRRDGSGKHSMLVHTSLESLSTQPATPFEFYFPAGKVIEQTPWITIGPDEAKHGNAIKKTAVRIDATEEYLSALPEPTETAKHGREDTAFMADIEDPNKAGDYEFGLDSATLMIRERQGERILREMVQQRSERTIFNDRAVELYLSGEDTNLLVTHILETMSDIEEGISFKDMQFNSEEGRQLFVRLVEETNIALVDIQAAFESNDTSELSVDFIHRLAARTAIARTLLQEIGAPVEWTRSKVFLGTRLSDPKDQVAYTSRVRQVASGQFDSNTFYIKSRTGRLGFNQAELANSGVDAYERSLAA